ncbi:hypothetical protein J23TS9_27450 [Paenibacillus sp. J23TS9]|nr:hypothetical protein J23TS9_27450 [Paenibacillus sp. J23TS9]
MDQTESFSDLVKSTTPSSEKLSAQIAADGFEYKKVETKNRKALSFPVFAYNLMLFCVNLLQ